jgi:hypothetical protein
VEHIPDTKDEPPPPVNIGAASTSQLLSLPVCLDSVISKFKENPKLTKPHRAHNRIEEEIDLEVDIDLLKSLDELSVCPRSQTALVLWVLSIVFLRDLALELP